MDELLQMLEQWHQDGEYQKIIDCLEDLARTQPLDYERTGLLARAYNNLAFVGDQKRFGKAIELLLSVEEQGRNDPLWHYRLGYACFYLDREADALAHFRRALELDPSDEDCARFIQQCEKTLSLENSDELRSSLALEKSAARWEEDGTAPNETEPAAVEAKAPEYVPADNRSFSAPEMYSPEEWTAVEAHMQQYFGPSEHVFHELVSPDIHVDIYIIAPTPERNYYILTTCGMGAHKMNVPAELADRKLSRAEILVTLPPDWKVDSSDERWYWPLRWLKILARLPIEENSWLGWGHTVANSDDAPFADNTRLCGVLLMEPHAFDEAAFHCPLPDGDEVLFYQMIPLYFDEMQYKLKHDAETLLSRFPLRFLEVLDVSRPSVCDGIQEKRLARPQESLQHLYDGEGPQGCIATDRIMVDGQPVGYCCRRKPAPGDEDWDSGWRFAAGDESRGDLDDPDRSGIYALNTLCNYDPDILPLLDSEPGVAWSRGSDGIFRPELL